MPKHQKCHIMHTFPLLLFFYLEVAILLECLAAQTECLCIISIGVNDVKTCKARTDKKTLDKN